MINASEIIETTAQHVRKLLEGEGSGHDWWHIQRVWNLSKRLSQSEPVNIFVVELAALLHDIADHKFHGGDETIGPKVAREWLERLQIDEPVVLHVTEIVKDLSFKGAEVHTPMRTLEGKIVQDADRLDAMGAIGIARAFAYGGFRNRELYNPNQSPTLHNSFDAYKNDKGHTINHFYEKLFLLKDRLNTDAAKQIAENRHQFMKKYVQRFLDEWNGKE